MSSASVIATKCTTGTSYQKLKPVLEKNCTISGCHDESMSKLNYNNYAILKSVAEKGKIEKRVLIDKNMPPTKKLSQAELDLFRCWLDGKMAEK